MIALLLFAYSIISTVSSIESFAIQTYFLASTSTPFPLANGNIEGNLTCGDVVYGDTNSTNATSYYARPSDEHFYRVELTDTTVFTVETGCTNATHTYDTFLTLYDEEGKPQ